MYKRESHQEREARKKYWVDKFSYVSSRLHSLLWVVAGAVAVYYSNFFHVIWHSDKVNPLFFGITLSGFTIFAIMTIYVGFILPQNEEVEVVAP